MNFTFLKESKSVSGNKSLLETGLNALFKTNAILSPAIDTEAFFAKVLTLESEIPLMQSRSFKLQPAA